jgi:hypothetical protein
MCIPEMSQKDQLQIRHLSVPENLRDACRRMLDIQHQTQSEVPKPLCVQVSFQFRSFCHPYNLLGKLLVIEATHLDDRVIGRHLIDEDLKAFMLGRAAVLVAANRAFDDARLRYLWFVHLFLIRLSIKPATFLHSSAGRLTCWPMSLKGRPSRKLCQSVLIWRSVR